MPTLTFIFAAVFFQEATALQWFADFEQESRILWNSPL